MKAVVITEPGDVEALQLIEVEPPEPRTGEVRLRVLAAAVNPVDLDTRAGFFHRAGWITGDRVGLGWDVAGIVDRVGPDVAGLRPGQLVAGLLDRLDVPIGTYAEQLVLPAASVAPVPDGLGAVAAATVPLNATTAIQALRLLDRSAGDRLLITGAAGAVGGYAVPLASAQGWRVTGLARAEDREFVLGAGASDAVTEVEDGAFDAVLDAAVLNDAALAAVRDGGTYVSLTPAALPATDRPVKITAVRVSANATDLAEALRLAAAGTLSVRVAGTLPLAEAGTAHRWLAKGGARGRWVLLP
ncbi:NADP-dependent oxidoreductase [Microlunatus sp. GCM10028923]|uniref:NADP-dependent oxidoreductase n=1 Tax=Microlunatus sp. GCM10028923 TaxID=3273400 RepID=UPI00361DAF6F